MEVFDDETIEGEKIHFIALLQPSLGRGDPASSSSQRRLVSNYGLRLNEIVLLWLHLLVRGFDVGDRRDQLLWTLYWLRVYAPESACVTHFRPTPTEKTYRAAVKKFVGFIANLNLVRIFVAVNWHQTHFHHHASSCRSAGNDVSKIGKSKSRAFRLTAPTAAFTCRLNGLPCDQSGVAATTALARSSRTSRIWPHCGTMFVCTSASRSLFSQAVAIQLEAGTISLSHATASLPSCVTMNEASPTTDTMTIVSF
jgi:hypothetical protein